MSTSAPRELVIETPTLKLLSHYRHFGGDEGPSLEVHVPAGAGGWQQVLRYDCFRDFPHRHIFYADGGEDRERWGTGGAAGAVAATADDVTLLADRLRQAGYPEAAERVVNPDVASALAHAVEDLRSRLPNG
ncbi:MAG: DUF7718 family protein [Chloroflexota bacterium]